MDYSDQSHTTNCQYQPENSHTKQNYRMHRHSENSSALNSASSCSSKCFLDHLEHCKLMVNIMLGQFRTAYISIYNSNNTICSRRISAEFLTQRISQIVKQARYNGLFRQLSYHYHQKHLQLLSFVIIHRKVITVIS